MSASYRAADVTIIPECSTEMYCIQEKKEYFPHSGSLFLYQFSRSLIHLFLILTMRHLKPDVNFFLKTLSVAINASGMNFRHSYI